MERQAMTRAGERPDRIRWLKELKEAIPKGADQVSARTVEIWSHRLVHIPMPVLYAAANVLVERLTFFPALAEILEVCHELQDASRDREWKDRLEEWKQEALSAGEATRLLAEVNERAGTALVPARGGMSRMAKAGREVTPIGGGMTDAEWKERKRRLKEKVGA